MIDLHSHILPGLDDGPDNWDEALAMALVASRDGIGEMVCTPHWVLGKYENSGARILPRFAEFQARLAAEKIPLKIHAGAELRIDTTLLPRLESGELLTLNNGSGYILLELPDENVPSDLGRFFWELQLNGYRPILSHVERNPFLRANPQHLFEWVGRGILTQITAVSLHPDFDPAIREFALFLLRHRLAHMVVTDTHSLRMRRPELSGAFRAVAELIGEQTAVQMVCETPRRILNGESVPMEDPIPVEPERKTGRMKSFLQSARMKANLTCNSLRLSGRKQSGESGGSGRVV